MWIADCSRDNLLITSAVNVFELACGWDSRRATDAGMLLLREFIILPLDTRSALEASLIDTELRRRGTPLDAGDLLIAGVARANGLAVITRNVRHFARIERLEVVAPTVT